jgi:hypothetical protein
LVALLATVGTLAMPWVFHRGTDKFRWQSVFTTKQAWISWAYFSIVIFAAVLIAGRHYGLAVAAACLLVVDGIYAYGFSRRFRSARHLDALCTTLEKRPTDENVAALGAALAAFRIEGEGRLNGYAVWVQWTHRAAIIAIATGRAEAARRWLDAVDPVRLDHDGRPVHAARLAVTRIELGDRSGARQILARVARPAAVPATEQALAALEGLLEALDGDAATALAKADAALDGPLDPTIRATWRVVRAHALERAGAPAEAREVLLALRGEYGERVLRRIANHGGPASASAATLLASPTPYR